MVYLLRDAPLNLVCACRLLRGIISYHQAIDIMLQVCNLTYGQFILYQSWENFCVTNVRPEPWFTTYEQMESYGLYFCDEKYTEHMKTANPTCCQFDGDYCADGSLYDFLGPVYQFEVKVCESKD